MDFEIEGKNNGNVILNTIKDVKDDVKGEGLRDLFNKAKDKVKNFIKEKVDLFRSGPRDNASPPFRKFLNEHGNEVVKKLEIGRTPVNHNIQKFLNAISLGGLERGKKKLGYDDVYHNFLLMYTDKGNVFKVERNHVIQASKVSNIDFQRERENVPINKRLTIKEMIDRAAKDDPKFWEYNARERNCQYFAKDVIKDNGLESGLSPKGREIYEPQNAAALLDSMGRVAGLATNFITDISSRGDKAIYGQGLEKMTVNDLFEIANRRK